MLSLTRQGGESVDIPFEGLSNEVYYLRVPNYYRGGGFFSPITDESSTVDSYSAYGSIQQTPAHLKNAYLCNTTGTDIIQLLSDSDNDWRQIEIDLESVTDGLIAQRLFQKNKWLTNGMDSNNYLHPESVVTIDSSGAFIMNDFSNKYIEFTNMVINAGDVFISGKYLPIQHVLWDPTNNTLMFDTTFDNFNSNTPLYPSPETEIHIYDSIPTWFT